MPREQSSAYWRYQARTWIWMGIYVAVLLAVIWLFGLPIEAVFSDEAS